MRAGAPPVRGKGILPPFRHLQIASAFLRPELSGLRAYWRHLRGLEGLSSFDIDDSRLAITAALREAINANPSEFDPRAFFKPAREAQKQVCVARMQSFGSAGHGHDYTVLSLDEMKSRYAGSPVSA